jgi:hypothetical protein
VLAIIEHQQQLLFADGARQCLAGNLVATEVQSEHASVSSLK